MEKLDFSAKICNIFETQQDKDIVGIECLRKVACELSFGTKIGAFEWLLEVT